MILAFSGSADLLKHSIVDIAVKELLELMDHVVKRDIQQVPMGEMILVLMGNWLYQGVESLLLL